VAHPLVESAQARLGWPGGAALALLAAAAVFYAVGLGPEQARLAALKREVAQLRESATRPQEPARTPAEMLGAFTGFFPASSRLPIILGTLFDAARAQSLSLEQGEYRVSTAHVGKLVQYQITLPVRGTYPQIRRFIDTALANSLALSLDSIHFERQKIESATVEAKVRLIAYLGGEQ